MKDGYHYRECGLDSVFLINGFRFHDGPRGKTVSIDDIDGLHRAIGVGLVRKKQRLTGKELRFLRTEMLLSQATLAQVLGVRELTVARWEKEQSEIPVATDAVVRQMYSDTTGQKHHPIRDLLERIADLEDKLDQHLTLKRPQKGWEIVKDAA